MECGGAVRRGECSVKVGRKPSREEGPAPRRFKTRKSAGFPCRGGAGGGAAVAHGESEGGVAPRRGEALGGGMGGNSCPGPGGRGGRGGAGRGDPRRARETAVGAQARGLCGRRGREAESGALSG